MNKDTQFKAPHEVLEELIHNEEKQVEKIKKRTFCKSKRRTTDSPNSKGLKKYRDHMKRRKKLAKKSKFKNRR